MKGGGKAWGEEERGGVGEVGWGGVGSGVEWGEVGLVVGWGGVLLGWRWR